MSPPAFSRVLHDSLAAGRFTCTVEVVSPTVEEDLETALGPVLALARYAKGEPRISAIAVTDRVKSDRDRDPVDVAHRVALECGKAPLVHLAGKDRGPRDLARSLEWMSGLGLRDVLLVTGDRLKDPPSDRRVRYHDSVDAIWQAKRTDPSLLVAAAVSPFKYREEELLNQHLKLGKKRRAGADVFMSQIGFDMEKARELLRITRDRGERVPVVAGVLFLTALRGRYLRKVGIPGIVITDDLQDKLEEEAREPDRGQDAAFRRLALQIVGLRHMGYAGVQVSGLVAPERIGRLLDLADRLLEALPTPEAWAPAWGRALAFADGRPVTTAPPGGLYLFGSDAVRAGAPAPAAAGAGEYLRFRILDVVDRVFFERGAPGAAVLAPLMRLGAGHAALGRLLIRAERAVKAPLVGCESCGFCRLPYTAYVCPETCPKGLANGPCGGTREGLCEFGDRECVHDRKYRLLKRVGRLHELEDILIPPVPDHTRGTCSWSNHFARDAGPLPLDLRRERRG
jgi:methylenetetrahydrofolate reductase (NADPH)